MRLLIINPNTSTSVTHRIAAAAGHAALPNDDFRVVAAPFGVPLIVDDEDARVAADAVLAAVESDGRDVDGIIIASFGDTGIEAVRRRVHCPVIGIAGAALLTARAIGERFSIVSFAPSVVPGLRAIAARYGMTGRLVGIRVVEGARCDDPDRVQIELREPLGRLCELACADGCDSIILGGGPLAGLARELVSPRITRPLIDGTTAAVHLMRGVLACSR